MGGLRQYLQLQAQARSGLSSGLLVWGLVAIVFGTLTATFIVLIAFILLAERYEPLIAASVARGPFPAGHDRRALLLAAVAAPHH